MKIFFVENRYTVWLYSEVARQLRNEGHEIHWLLQNPMFRPNIGAVHRLPFPSRASSNSCDPEFDWILRTDRSVRQFGNDGSHYRHYSDEIQKILARERPEVVFGEATQFHELLCIEHCRRLGIPYLSPNATRYPPGRVSFFLYDTMEPHGGSGDELDDRSAEEMLQAIVNRRLIPSYMQRSQPAAWRRYQRRLESLRVVAGWLAGERYVTPSPFRKLVLERQHKKLVQLWEQKAHTSLPKQLANRPWVLYPLQMQPEGNIDVWGQPWNDQAEIIRRAAKALSEIDAFLVVKPNPKSKYELSEDLVEEVSRLPNVVPLSHRIGMKDIFADVPAVLTVTGTVMLECILAAKPVAVLGEHFMSRLPGTIKIQNPEAIRGIFDGCNGNEGRFSASHKDGITFLKETFKNSYEGLIFCPLADHKYLTSANTSKLAAAFRDQLSLVEGCSKGCPAP